MVLNLGYGSAVPKAIQENHTLILPPAAKVHDAPSHPNSIALLAPCRLYRRNHRVYDQFLK